MRFSIFPIAVIACGISINALAKDSYSPEYDSCIEKSGGVTFDMVECSNAELSRQDSRLNRAYKGAMSVLTDERKVRLQEAQRLWIKFRDADCGIYYNLSGGTMDMINGSGCELSMTKERANALEWIARNGGD